MKKRKKRALKPFSWKAHKKPVVVIALIVVIFSAFLLVIYDPMRPGNEILGRLQSEYKQNLDSYVAARFVVKLDDGQLVDVPANRMGAFQKNRRVVLQEMTGLFFRRKAYRFVKYIQP